LVVDGGLRQIGDHNFESAAVREDCVHAVRVWATVTGYRAEWNDQDERSSVARPPAPPQINAAERRACSPHASSEDGDRRMPSREPRTVQFTVLLNETTKRLSSQIVWQQ